MHTYIRKLANLAMVLLTFLVAGCLKPQTAQKDEIRPPAIPLITIDPYTSCWLFGDELNGQDTRHWTGEPYRLNGYIQVDSETYRFMGAPEYEVFLPLADEGAYDLSYTTDYPGEAWSTTGFDDATWEHGPAPVGWDTTNTGVKSLCDTDSAWARRKFTWTPSDGRDFSLILNHMGKTARDMNIYINGVFAASAAQARVKREYPISQAAKDAMVEGENILGIYWSGRSYQKTFIDAGLLKEKVSPKAQQTGYSVTATQTHFTFTAGGVDLSVSFTSPLVMDDLDLMTRPVNYITYEAKSADGNDHSVRIYFDAAADWVVNSPRQKVIWEKYSQSGLAFAKLGSLDQPVLEREGDGVCIDWGYLYFASQQADNKQLQIAALDTCKLAFRSTGHLPMQMDKEQPRAAGDRTVGLCFVDDLGTVGTTAKKDFLMLAYDDISSIEYFGEPLKAWWARQGKTIHEAIVEANADYARTLERCHVVDSSIYYDALAVGNHSYAELCKIAYRQAISAHKLVAGPSGEALFLSKENYSNGSIGTVDVTYPSAPMFLVYNPNLLKGMLEPIFYYSESGKWEKPFAAHDVGKYPKANGQKYKEDMPVEECGNMLIMTAAICAVEKNFSYAMQHWPTLTVWANYLAEKGFDPEEQLCTDDFAGHLAHNANLSVKAIVGLGAYAQMARSIGDTLKAAETYQMAKQMAGDWQIAADAETHYSLTFDKKDTWSQKYNLVWDELLNLDLFPDEVVQKEMNYYLSVQNEFGLPLDSRETYTKSDWILWTAAMAKSQADFDSLIAPVYRFANESPDRVPLSDWHDTKSNQVVGFRARSVVGGYYMQVLKMLMLGEKD